jgi:DNA-binding NarL/FixJ family response regulator
MLNVLVVEDNEPLQNGLRHGLDATGSVHVSAGCASGEEALEVCLEGSTDVALMDLRLAGKMNGIEAAIAIRRELPRFPTVFYSIQDDDATIAL